MRRLAAICVLAGISTALFFAQFAVSGGTAQTPLVVADNIAARALAISPIDSRPSIYFTNAASPNRIFTLTPTTEGSNGAARGLSVTVLAGTGAAGSLGDGGTAVAAQFDLSPDSLIKRSGIAVAPDGTIYVADTQNSTIRTIGATTSTEPDVIRSVVGRWAPRQNTALAEPLGIAFDLARNLYIADHASGAVDVLRADTGEVEVLAHVISPASIAVTPRGNKIFVASPDNGAVFAIDTQTRAIEIVPGFSAPGASAASSGSLAPEATDALATSIACGQVKSGAAASGTNQPVCPAGLAVDGGANLFIADANSGQILRVDAQTNNNTVAARGLSAPGAIAFNTRGDLYVAEQGRNRIVELQQAGSAQSNISLSPASAGFVSEPVGGVSPATAFSLANNSASAATGVLIGIAGANPADFTVVNTNCGAALSASSACTINVDSAPHSSGSRSATLTVSDSNPNDLATANLYTLGLSPTSASYRNEPVGGTAPTQQFTLSNSSPGVAITGLSVAMGGANPADFMVEGKSCTTTLAASSACTINVAFTPQSTGSRTATLAITEPGGASTSATLSGKGDDFQLQLASGQTSEVSVTPGGTATFNAQVVPIGPFGSSGEKVSFVCPSNLPANATCRFSPNSVGVTPGQPASFQIILATTNQAGTTAAMSAPRILPGLGASPPRGPFGLLPSAAEAPQLTVRASLFPSLGALAIFAGVLAVRWRGRGPIHLLAVVALLGGVLAGCHKKSTASSLATPTGTSVMTIEGNAVDAAGNPLNAGRSLTITLDVTK